MCTGKITIIIINYSRFLSTETPFNLGLTAFFYCYLKTCIEVTIIIIIVISLDTKLHLIWSYYYYSHFYGNEFGTHTYFKNFLSINYVNLTPVDITIVNACN